jgi:hypothetical protein
MARSSISASLSRIESGIDDLTVPLSAGSRVLRAGVCGVWRQVPNQLFLQHSACLDEQATVNRFVDTHILVIGMLDFQPSGNLFGHQSGISFPATLIFSYLAPFELTWS